jgi:hypothetical protein
VRTYRVLPVEGGGQRRGGLGMGAARGAMQEASCWKSAHQPTPGVMVVVVVVVVHGG